MRLNRYSNKTLWMGLDSYSKVERTRTLRTLRSATFKNLRLGFREKRENQKLHEPEEKKQIKLEKDKAEEKYMWATMNGKREQVGNLEWNSRDYSVVEVNIQRWEESKGAFSQKISSSTSEKTRKCQNLPLDTGGRKCDTDQTVTWMAGWNDSINTKDWKYVQFGATSSVKSESDKQKFEKARTLHEHIGKIRDDYRKNMRKDNKETAQLAVTTYLVDKLALRA